MLHAPVFHEHTHFGHLPNELLSAIIAYLNNADLCRLSLVTKRLHEICQREFFNCLTLPEGRTRIPKLIRTLVDSPNLANLIGTIEISNTSRVRCMWAEIFTQKEDEYLDKKLFIKCRSTIRRSLGKRVWMESFKAISDSRRQVNQAFLLAILVGLAPNLRGITFEMLPCPDHSRNYPHALCNSPFGKAATDLLRDKLQVLRITEIPPGKGHMMHNVSLWPMPHLRELSMPSQTLFRDTRELADFQITLPERLEVLELHDCDNKLIYHWLLQLEAFVIGNERCKPKAHLRKIDLYFKTCIRSALLLSLLFQATPCEVASISTALISLKCTKKIKVNAYTMMATANYHSIDLALEIESYQKMTADERMISSYKTLELSDVVARHGNGSPRPRSQFEITLLRKFLHMPLELFTSPTLNPLAWSGVRMFNGAKRHPDSMRSSILPKHQDQRHKKESNVLGETSTLFNKPRMPDQLKDVCVVVRNTPGFNAEKWIAETFFGPSLDISTTSTPTLTSKIIQTETPTPVTALPKHIPTRVDSLRKHRIATRPGAAVQQMNQDLEKILEKAQAWRLS